MVSTEDKSTSGLKPVDGSASASKSAADAAVSSVTAV